MKELPEKGFFDGFYIWFDIDNKKEYYSTPLYQYKTKSSGNFEDRKQAIKLEKSISKCKPSKKDEALKYPAFIIYPYEENIGHMLLKFLNADFSTFENSYDTFFFAYGYELLNIYGTYECLKGRFDTELEMLKTLKGIFQNSMHDLEIIQYDFRNCIDFLYNLNENEELKDSKVLSKLIASVIKRRNNMNYYARDIEVILDSYTNKCYDYQRETLESLIKKLDEKNTYVKMTNIYTSSNLPGILFVILEQIARTDNLVIKKCQNCGKYFIPIYRQNEIYCDFENIDGSPTCREKGASETYRKNLESIPALLEYRRTYQKKIMIASRNKEDKQLRKDFDKWKKEAQAKIKLYKQNKLSENELYNWMIENK